MSIDHIRGLITGGFKPFTIHVSDGRRFPVPHPEFIAIGKKVVVVITKGDRVNTIDPIHITSIEDKLAHT